MLYINRWGQGIIRFYLLSVSLASCLSSMGTVNTPAKTGRTCCSMVSLPLAIVVNLLLIRVMLMALVRV